MKSLGRQLLVLCIALFITLSSLWLPKTVQNKAEMQSVQRGFPFAFYIQDISSLNPESLPQTYSLLNPLEYSRSFNSTNFLLSFAVFLLLTEGAYLLLFNKNLKKK